MTFLEAEIIRYTIIVLLALFFTWLILAALRRQSDYQYKINDFEKREAGKRGEREATKLIKSVCREDDYLFTNVQVSYEGKEAELDNVVVNSKGVFIFEVKSYSGILVGDEEDESWTKYHESSGGNVYEKTVRNPIPQVKRQVYILAKYLNYYGISVWVDGYAIILGAKSPIASEMIIRSVPQIDEAIHLKGKNKLKKSEVEKICKLFEEER